MRQLGHDEKGNEITNYLFSDILSFVSTVKNTVLQEMY